MVFPVLTPLAFDPGRPFPYISNLSLNLAVIVRDQEGVERFARVKVPGTLPHLVPLRRSSGSARKDGTVPFHHYFVWLEQVIAANLDMLFPGMQIVAAYAFRVIRDADVAIQELEADDLLETMEESVRQRRFGSVVRISVNDAMPAAIRDLLIENLEVDRNDVYAVNGPLGLASLMSLYNMVDRHDLKDPPFLPTGPAGAERQIGRREYFRHPAARRRSCCITPTTRSRRWSISCAPPRATRTCWPSSRRSTGWGATRRWWRRCWRPWTTASRWRCWWSSRRASTRRATSAGPRSWRPRACTWSTGCWA